MNRKKFITSIAAVGTVGAVLPGNIYGSKSGVNSIKIDEDQLSKVKAAMLATQRRSWEQGTAMQALYEINDTNTLILLAYEAILRKHSDGRIGMVDSENNVTDPVSNGLGAKYAFDLTGDNKFKVAVDKLLDYCMETAPRLQNGAISHVLNEMQVWSDSMFMLPPFLALMGEYNESIRQIEAYREYLWDDNEKLFHHIWSEDKNTFENESFWGGGNGWCAAGMAIVIDLLPESMEKEKNTLEKYLVDLLNGCLTYIRPDGLFYNNITDPDSFVETNLSQMLAYSIFKGHNSGWLPSIFVNEAKKMRETVLTKIDPYGRVLDACGSPYFDKQGTSTEAQAFCLMMEGQTKKLTD